jgi:hypothetical protein
MLSEHEILSRHVQALQEAKDQCLWFSTQQDKERAAPRGHHYTLLREALKLAEGSARQMAHYRGDARWVRIGAFCAKLMRKVQILYVGQQWRKLGLLAEVFDGQMWKVEDFKHRRTDTLGVILPTPGKMDWIRQPEGTPLLPGTWSPLPGLGAPYES